MPKKFPAEVRDRAVRMTLDRLSEYPTIFAACKALAPKLDVGVETLRKWVVQAQIDTGVKTGPTSAELEEIKKLKSENGTADGLVDSSCLGFSGRVSGL